MKPIYTAATLFVMLLSLTMLSFNREDKTLSKDVMTKSQDSVLRHVVLFKFKEGTAPKKITEIEEAFSSLPSKISEIVSYEWGLNNSPEGLEKGFTHCFFLTFNSEADRAVYLPHPDHKAFGALLTPYLDDVLVVDYWTN